MIHWRPREGNVETSSEDERRRGYLRAWLGEWLPGIPRAARSDQEGENAIVLIDDHDEQRLQQRSPILSAWHLTQARFQPPPELGRDKARCLWVRFLIPPV